MPGRRSRRSRRGAGAAGGEAGLIGREAALIGPRGGVTALAAATVDLTSAPLLPNVSSCPMRRDARQGGPVTGPATTPQAPVIRLRIARLGVCCSN